MGFLTKNRGKKRKFKPPKFIQQKPKQPNSNSIEPPLKKRRRNSKNKENSNPNKKRASFKQPRRDSSESPLEFARKREESQQKQCGGSRTWTVFHCKRSHKKHKNYIDGILRQNGKKLYLFDADSAKQITAALWQSSFEKKINNSEPIFFGSFQVEIDSLISESDFESGKCFHSANAPKLNTNNNKNNGVNRAFKPIALNSERSQKKNKNRSFKIPSKIDENGVKIDMSSQYNIQSLKPVTDWTKIDNPLILNTADLNSDYSNVKVVCVASFLSSKLRKHQRIGVKYMYECVMGTKNGSNQTGVILADEMGLGKTLQCIALIYTLLNEKLIRKCLIISPSSLVGNWKKEFRKWIIHTRKGKCDILAMNEKRKEKQTKIIQNFICKSTNTNVLIIGYEMLRSHISQICKGNIGLIVCDEGHRLKNSKGNATITALNKIQTKKRVLLTGTPIQNKLSELYAMCNWVNPLCLNANHFRNTYERPIEKSRDSNASVLEQKLGDQRSKALNKITQTFILRRTSEVILKKYLKRKDEYIIFHKMSKVQILLYKSILNQKSIRAIVSECNVQKALECLLYMRMCCASPKLALNKLLNSTKLNIRISNHIKSQIYHNEDNSEKSEKFKVLKHLVRECVRVKDRIVIVSNFTSILSEVEKVIESEYKYLRLDGSTNTQQRTKLVAQFNDKKNDTFFIFLLSAKAGGMGLNLIGANRLVLLDPAWNPAIDAQAMARIWRDGQRKECKIYRFISAGAIEEKILQRQIMKCEINDSVVDRHGKAKHKHKERHFSKEELKEIFTLDANYENGFQSKYALRDWNIITNESLIQTIIPSQSIMAIFHRAIEARTESLMNWKLKENERETEYKSEGNESESESEEIQMESNEFNESDMDCDSEYVLQTHTNTNTNEDSNEESEDMLIVMNSDESNGNNKNKNKNRFFEEESESDTEDIYKRELKHSSDENNQNTNDSMEKEAEQMQQTQGSIDDLDTNFTFDEWD